jgi:multidrug efflux pump subunit AcrA (membrane-fusion protein)
MKDTIKRISIAFVILILGVAGFRIGYKIIQSLKKSKELVYDVAGVVLKKEKAAESTLFSGVISGDPQVKVYPLMNGKFSRNTVEEGALVSKDESLVLVDRDQIGSFEMMPVKAPIGGIVIKLYYRDPGAEVSPYKPVAEVGNPYSIKIVISSGSADLIKIKKGQKARIITGQPADTGITGIVDSVSTSISKDNPAGRIVIKALNRDKKLLIGQSVSAEVFTGNSDVFLVPERAVLLGEARAYVFINNGGRASEVNVTPGNVHGRNIEISGNIFDGQEIVINGAFQISDGAKINFIKNEPLKNNTATDTESR